MRRADGILLLAILPHAIAQPVPRAWTDDAGFELPLAVPERSPRQMPASEYYRLPAAAIWKSYPVYRPDKEPRGYLEWLKTREPVEEHPFHAGMTEPDWIAAGRMVFDLPTKYIEVQPDTPERRPELYRDVPIPSTPDGVVPFWRYFIREKGRIEMGMDHCGSCHSRVMPDGTVLRGAQGNLPASQMAAWIHQHTPRSAETDAHLQDLRWSYYGAPWISPRTAFHPAGYDEAVRIGWATPAWVIAREGTSMLAPPKIPDLIGVRDRRYLDATGLMRHRRLEDLMRYAALNQTIQLHARYGDFQPLPADPAQLRYSDEQLFALAKFVDSLQAPRNPNRVTALTRRGEQLFHRQGCAVCHTPPLYTSNRLTPAAGFRVPAEHWRSYDITPVVVGTDPTLALETRRGTGYYKIPSLRGVWYRNGFGHGGWCANLEDWFDPRRLRSDYVPTGFHLHPGPVEGHRVGLELSAGDRAALIAFLRTL